MRWTEQKDLEGSGQEDAGNEQGYWLAGKDTGKPSNFLLRKGFWEEWGSWFKNDGGGKRGSVSKKDRRDRVKVSALQKDVNKCKDINRSVTILIQAR